MQKCLTAVFSEFYLDPVWKLKASQSYETHNLCIPKTPLLYISDIHECEKKAARYSP